MNGGSKDYDNRENERYRKSSENEIRRKIALLEFALLKEKLFIRNFSLRSLFFLTENSTEFIDKVKLNLLI